MHSIAASNEKIEHILFVAALAALIWLKTAELLRGGKSCTRCHAANVVHDGTRKNEISAYVMSKDNCEARTSVSAGLT
jgi:hypothetical protein